MEDKVVSDVLWESKSALIKAFENFPTLTRVLFANQSVPASEHSHFLRDMAQAMQSPVGYSAALDDLHTICSVNGSQVFL